MMQDGRPVYKVTGGITVPPDEEVGDCRKQLVARDGIEPRRQPFQGRRANWLTGSKALMDSVIGSPPSGIVWDVLG